MGYSNYAKLLTLTYNSNRKGRKEGEEGSQEKTYGGMKEE